MASLEHIAKFVQGLNDEELREVSLEILRQVRGRLQSKSKGLWTAPEIARWLSRDADDPIVAKSLQMFVAQRQAQLLDVHYIYYSPWQQDDEGELIADEYVAMAYQTGALEDPQTGRLVHDFEATLQPYFVPAFAVDGDAACV